MFWSDDKKLLLGVNVISWNSLYKKKKNFQTFIQVGGTLIF